GDHGLLRGQRQDALLAGQPHTGRSLEGQRHWLMNDESRFTSSIRQALDESTERLPWRVTHRLEQAREKALARLDEREAQAGSSIGHGVRSAANPAPTQATAGD